MKTCTKCQATLPATLKHFSRNKNCRGGLNSTCRSCLQAYQQAYREQNKERLREEKREWYRRHNPKERYRTALRIAKELHPLRVRARLLRQGMRERARLANLPFDDEHFSVSRLIQMIQGSSECPCCHKPIDYSYKDGKPKNSSPSIDRMNPRKGYTLDNVTLICWRCNNLKRDASADELEMVAKWMRSHAKTL